MSVSIEALAMAGADYLECNLELESSLPPPHLLADDEEEEFWGKKQSIKPSNIPGTSSHQSKDVPYESESDSELNEGDLITTMNLSCRKDEVVSKLLLKLISFTASFKKEKLGSALAFCCLSGERRKFCEKMMVLTVLGFIQGLFLIELPIENV